MQSSENFVLDYTMLVLSMDDFQFKINIKKALRNCHSHSLSSSPRIEKMTLEVITGVRVSHYSRVKLD